MKTKKINIYEFEELKDDIKEKVISRFREGNEYYFLEECLNEELEEELKNNGIEEIGETELRYSLGYSQGDGLSFIGNFKYKNVEINIKLGQNSNYYSHSNTTDINRIEEYNDDENDYDITEELKIIQEQEKDEIEEEFKELYFDICRKLEKSGYAHIESENSDESITENIKANNYNFRENGEIE